MHPTWILALPLLTGTALAQERPEGPFHAGFEQDVGGTSEDLPPHGSYHGPPADHWHPPPSDYNESAATSNYTSSAVSTGLSSLSTTVTSTITMTVTCCPATSLPSSSSTSSSSSTTSPSSLSSSSSSSLSTSTSLATSSATSSSSKSTSSSESSSTSSTTASTTMPSTSSTTTGPAAPTRTPCLFLDTLFFFEIYSGSPDADPKVFYNFNGTGIVNLVRNTTTDFPSFSLTNCYNSNQCEESQVRWYGDVPNVVDFLPVTVPAAGGAARVYVDGMAASFLDLDYMVPTFLCTGGHVDSRDGKTYDDQTTDALLTLQAEGNDALHVPYECDQELRFYATGTTAPTECESITLRAVNLPAA